MPDGFKSVSVQSLIMMSFSMLMISSCFVSLSPLTQALQSQFFPMPGCSWELDTGEPIKSESRQDRSDGGGQLLDLEG